jgi:hypothetical protein
MRCICTVALSFFFLAYPVMSSGFIDIRQHKLPWRPAHFLRHKLSKCVLPQVEFQHDPVQGTMLIFSVAAKSGSIAGLEWHMPSGPPARSSNSVKLLLRFFSE